jgi:hypothetical protein
MELEANPACRHNRYPGVAFRRRAAARIQQACAELDQCIGMRFVWLGLAAGTNDTRRHESRRIPPSGGAVIWDAFS